MMQAAMSFLASRLGMVAIAAVLGFWLGYDAASKGAAVRALRAENQSLQREVNQARSDLARMNTALQQAKNENDALSQLQQELQEKVSIYVAELEAQRAAAAEQAQAQATDACRLDRNDVRRLRAIK